MQKYKNILTTKRLQKSLLPIAIALLAVCVYWAKQELSFSGLKSNSEPQSLQCNFVNSGCRLSLDGQALKARLDPAPVVEERITIALTLPSQMDIERAWIEGVNMYMGKVPVPLQRGDDGVWHGWFMLGSCSQPVMQWQMTVKIKGRSQPALFFFRTSQN